MIKSKNKKIVLSGMLIAIGIILPFFTAHGMGVPGNILLPMHIPVLLCGFLCGGLYGAICGCLLPFLNCIITGMPSVYPMLPIMTAELFVYGLVSGIVYNNTPIGKFRFGVYPALLIAMICGRIAYGFVFSVLLFMNSSLQALSVGAAAVKGLPGMIIQLLIIPGIVAAAEEVICGKRRKRGVRSAINLIREDRASCAVIKDGAVVRTEYGRGIGPMLALYKSGILKDSYVVDKIIGKASAMILISGKAKGCYGVTMSRGAVEILKQYKIKISYEVCVDKIINRTGDGICPMEQTVKDIFDPNEGVKALEEKLLELRQNQG